jgi:hypothetical protein
MHRPGVVFSGLTSATSAFSSHLTGHYSGNILEAILKMPFGPTRPRRINVFVGDSFQILDILKYACGL